jgi:protein-tyrosine phosphatase
VRELARSSHILRRAVIDLHCHVLPGIDDGPATLEASVAIARAAAAGGTRTLVATPHVSSRYPNDHGTIARLVDELRDRLAAERIALDVRAGAELGTTHLIDIDSAQLARFGLGGGPWLLVEPPFIQFANGLDGLLLDLQDRGHRVLLAHPERCPTFHRDPGMLESLVAGGILTSITAGALDGRFGGEVRRFALGLAAANMVHNVASDAHDTVRRGPAMADYIAKAGLDPIRDWLTHAVPQAILNGDETLPRRPPGSFPVTAARRGWRRA